MTQTNLNSLIGSPRNVFYLFTTECQETEETSVSKDDLQTKNLQNTKTEVLVCNFNPQRDKQKANGLLLLFDNQVYQDIGLELPP